MFSVSCLYNSNSVLTHDFTGGLLPVRQQRTVTFNFYPAEPIAYRETITFEINGLTRQSVEIKGKGAEFKVASTLNDCSDDRKCYGSVVFARIAGTAVSDRCGLFLCVS